MLCPFCGADDTQVKDSRPTEDGISIKRRRFCIKCNSRFTTFERVQLRELHVIKKNNDRKLFDRDKLTRSIKLAVRKRAITEEQVELVVNNIVRELESKGENEIPSSLIGEMAMNSLAELDKVAYVRFASVYREFRETDDFYNFIKSLK